MSGPAKRGGEPREGRFDSALSMRALRAALSQTRDRQCGSAESEGPSSLPRSWLAAARSERSQRAVSNYAYRVA